MHFIVDEDDDGSSPFGLAKSEPPAVAGGFFVRTACMSGRSVNTGEKPMFAIKSPSDIKPFAT